LELTNKGGQSLAIESKKFVVRKIMKEVTVKRLIAILLFSAVLLSCATTGEKMSRISPELTKAEIVDLFGSPDGFKKVATRRY
jgi:hypothetical protein